MKYFHLAIDGGIATVTLDNPHGPMNVVSPEWIEEFHLLLDAVIGDVSVQGVVITSAKPAFMAGADLKYLSTQAGRMDIKAAYAFSQRGTALHRRLETCGKPIVAAIGGLALGGGFELCLACHHRVLADSPKVLVGLPEVTVGLLPGSGGTQRLPRLIGVERALPLLLEGTSLKPADALAIGLVDAVVPPDRLLETARAFALSANGAVQPWDKKGYVAPCAAGLMDRNVANTFMAQAALVSAKSNHNQPAPIAILAAVFEGLQVPFETALRIELKYFAKLLTDPVSRNLIRTSFVNKGLAGRLERRPEGFEKRTVGKLGVLGAGMMGSGISHVAAVAGMDVVLIDANAVAAEKGKSYSACILGKDVARGRLSGIDADAVLARIDPTTNYARLAGCDLVIEAVFEDTAVKAEVTARAEAAVSPATIFASNTSTLPITRLAEAASRPEKFIGLHFFSPVERMPLVEVIVGKQTSRETLAHALDFVAQLRKTPIVVNDSRGFYTSRVFQTLIHEGAAMLGEGVAPALIENSARLCGMPVGPLALLDEVTLDLPLKIIRQAQDEEGNAYQPPCGYPVLQSMENLGRIGRRAGGGFYDYPEHAPKHLWEGLAEVFPSAKEQPDSATLRERFLCIQALETARCLEERVIVHPADGDLGAVFGWGFPAFTGGTISIIDTMGLPSFVAACDRFAQRYGSRFKPSEWLRDRATRNETFYS